MILYEDTRNKKGQHKLKNSYWKSVGVDVVRETLNFGDYVTTLENPRISVDTKADVAELAQNLINDHTRFRNMCIRAIDANSRLIILVENRDGVEKPDDLKQWINPRTQEYEMKKFLVQRGKDISLPKFPPPSGMRLFQVACTMRDRYGVQFEFCKPVKAGERVLELLDYPICRLF